VLYNEFGKRWKDNGYRGFLPRWLDTKLEASYVDENYSLGLKKLSKRWLAYDQTDYKTVTTREGPVGFSAEGRLKNTFQKVVQEAVLTVNEETHMSEITSPAVTELWERRTYKMNELSAKHVFEYATDDTITTAALHNFFKLFMELEGTYDVYKLVELDSSYQHTQSFVHGTRISVETVKELEREDELVSAEAWLVVRDYLIKKGWEGTQTPVYLGTLEPKDIKEAYEIVTGQPLKTSFRLIPKIVDLFAQQYPLLADCVTKAAAGDFVDLNTLVASRFAGEPEFNIGSPKQKVHLFYEVMGLPVRVANKATDLAKANGELEGTPKTDNLAISYAMLDADEEQKAVLNALRLMQMVKTRKGLYYSPYPYFVHWKTGRIHSSHNQCGTNTRRASSSKPNMQQVSKNEKVEGYSPRVREVYIPHKKDAVIVSMDFKAQELRVIADYSGDENMLACYIGEHKKDMHAMTGMGIFNTRGGLSWDYEAYFAALNDKSNEFYPEVKKTRGLGKTTNFTTEFGAAAPKLAQVLMITEEEAQIYIDAKLAAFPQVAVWKDSVIAEAKQRGYVCTKLGARRHLRELLQSPDRYTANKAERQAVNFKVQSSSAEMTKAAEGRMWQADLESRFDCEIIGAIHDEVIASVAVKDLLEFIPIMHHCMVQPYGNMYVPIESSISLGKTFGPAHQIEMGDRPDRDAIIAALNEAGVSHNFEEVTA
jgi:DNA polymerase I-like protein with 3'-5' exonuclease and polymerase domains